MGRVLSSRRLLWTRVFVFILGVAFLSLGLWRDEALYVLRRAITICLGCIGIG